MTAAILYKRSLTRKRVRDDTRMLNDFHNTLFDSHSHFFGEEFDHDRDAVVERSVEAGVARIIDVAVDLASAQQTLDNSKRYKGIVLPTIGIHPEIFVPGSDLVRDSWGLEQMEAEIKKIDDILAHNPGYVMIGECGMDLYWLRKNLVDDLLFENSKELQAQCFRRQVELAKKYMLPLTIHARDAVDECLEILSEYQGRVEAIFHSFTGNYVELKKIIDAGFAIGINGIVTYKSAETLREALKMYIGEKKITEPRDLYELCIYLETDAPYLMPSGVAAGHEKRNQPVNISLIWNAVLK